MEGRRVSFRNWVKALQDSTVGYVTMKDQHGIVMVEALGSRFECVSLIAMADDEDIRKCCKVVKQLQVGDLIIGIEPATVDPATSLTRVVVAKTVAQMIMEWVSELALELAIVETQLAGDCGIGTMCCHEGSPAQNHILDRFHCCPSLPQALSLRRRMGRWSLHM